MNIMTIFFSILLKDDGKVFVADFLLLTDKKKQTT